MSLSIRAAISLALITSAAHASAEPTDGSENFGEYVVHYSALSTMILNAQMAEKYAIERSDDRGLLNLSVQKMLADGTTEPVAASITGVATNLTGQKSAITIREISGEYISYIGLFDVVAPDTYTFKISITPEGSDRALALRFSKNFVPE